MDGLSLTCLNVLSESDLSDVFNKQRRKLAATLLRLKVTSRFQQGCTGGRHSDKKPQEPLRPEVSSDKGDTQHTNSREIIYQGPKSAEVLQKERPR